MKIEHIGICVSNPLKMGRWYSEYLGFKILRELGIDSEGVIFIEDDSGNVIEIGNIPEVKPVDLSLLSPLAVHLAIECDNPALEAERLLKAGAEMVGESVRNEYKGEKILLRDPWGKLTIQLINRKTKLKNPS